jgi:DNA-binding transcriptional regulator LsrR (DeoR family)
MALVGIGTVQPSKLLAESGNIFSEEELDTLRRNGAIGDILLHFFDEDGIPVKSFLDNRVISMKLNQLRNVERSIGVAGGKRKLKAIRASLRGKWINILITDNHTAKELIKNT